MSELPSIIVVVVSALTVAYGLLLKYQWK